MPNQIMEVLTQLIQKSLQPALLINLSNRTIVAYNEKFIELCDLKQNKIATSDICLQLIQQTQILANKGLLFFNFEFFNESKIFLSFTEVRDQYAVIYLQEKYTDNIPSNHLLKILNSLGAQVYCKDTNYRYTYANQKVGILFNKKSEDLIGTDDSANFDQASFAKIKNEIDDLTSGKIKKIEQEETLFIKSLNTTKTFLSVKKPLYGKDKKNVGMFGISTDISKYKATENRLNAILNNLPVYIYVKDLDQRFLYANKMIQELFDYPLDFIKGKTAGELLGQEREKEYEPLDLKLIETESTVEGIEKFYAEDKIYHYYSVKAPIFDSEGKLTSLIGMSTDITKNIELEKKFEEANKKLKVKIKQITELKNSLWEQATHDPLTQLFNRRYFNDYLEKEILKVQRNKNPLALLLLDADYFKNINDKFGHDIGDKVLIKLAKIMIGECRRSDVVCRYGGEEFMILMPNVNLETAMDRAEKIRLRYQKEISEFLQVENTISIGIAMWNEDFKNLEGLAKATDLAMYQAKENGRNQVVVYNSDLVKQ